MKETDEELAELEQKREQAALEVEETAGTEQTLNWLRSVEHWVDILDVEKTTPAERNKVYRQCIRGLVVDATADTVSLEWMPALAKLIRRNHETLHL
jgi:hypothetical protein